MTFVGLDPDLLRIEAQRFLEVAKESQALADEYREIGRLGQMEEFTNITVNQLEEVHDELLEADNLMLRKCDEMEALFAPGGALSGGLGQPPTPIPTTLALATNEEGLRKPSEQVSHRQFKTRESPNTTHSRKPKQLQSDLGLSTAVATFALKKVRARATMRPSTGPKHHQLMLKPLGRLSSTATSPGLQSC